VSLRLFIAQKIKTGGLKVRPYAVPPVLLNFNFTSCKDIASGITSANIHSTAAKDAIISTHDLTTSMASVS